MSQNQDGDEAARMELGSDAWHRDEDGEYYVDCPECGSAATVRNVTEHGRCNGYLDDEQSDTEFDEAEMSCTAKLTFELVYESDPEETVTDEEVREDDTGSDGEIPGESTDSSAESS